MGLLNPHKLIGLDTAGGALNVSSESHEVTPFKKEQKYIGPLR